MSAPEFGNIKLNNEYYRVLIGRRRKSDIVDFSPRASVAAGSVIHSELGLYQAQLQTSWQHGFGFIWNEDALGYMKTYGNMDTRHAGIAMMYTDKEASTPSGVKRNGFTSWKNAEWSWGDDGLHRFDGDKWTQEYGVVSPIKAKTTTWGKGAAVTSLTFDVKIPEDSKNNLVLVTVHLKTDVAISSVTLVGTAMTSHSSVGTAPKIALYKQINPARGVQSVVVTLASAADIIATATPFVNVDQNTPLDVAVTDSGTGTTATKAVTSAADDLVFAMLAVDDNVDLTLGASQTSLADLFRGDLVGAASTEPGAGSVTMSWTWSGSLDFELIGANINNAVHTKIHFA